MANLAKAVRIGVGEQHPTNPDPYVRLAQAIILQAMCDLISDDPDLAWDAQMWFADPRSSDLLWFAGISPDRLGLLTTDRISKYRKQLEVNNLGE